MRLARKGGFWREEREIYLREIDAERAHVEPVQEAAEALVEAAEAFVQELQVHEVGFEVGHAVA